jgi:iron complex transport system permease protein
VRLFNSPYLWLVFAITLLGLTPFFGAEPLNWKEVFVPGSPSHRIVFELRLPRVLLTFLVGGSLAMLGGTYQILFRNALAEPYLLGVSSAVTLGLVIGEVLFHWPPVSFPSLTLGAALALTTTVGLIALYLSGSGNDMERIILFGMGMNFILSSTVFLILSYAYQQVGGGTFRWLFGQVPWITLREVVVLAAVAVPLLVILWIYARRLDALSLGDAVARTLGVDPTRTRIWLLVVSSALISLLVMFTGAVGFVGLVIPNAVRLFLRPASTRASFHASFVGGSVFLALTDLLSRKVLPPFEFPIGIVTTLLGGPIFLFLLWRRNR